MSPELGTLRVLSAKVGSNPLLVQAAGGNTSIKDGDIMWIKASGAWLRDAVSNDIFVPLDFSRLSAALAADDPACEACTDFVRSALNPSGLRPSIETSVHGLLPQRIVVHVHCVNTLAFAIQTNAEALLTPPLKLFNWAFVPYARPGLMLSRAIKTALRPGVDVLVLGNHGLVVAADTVADAAVLLHEVVAALDQPARDFGSANTDRLEAISTGTGYRLPEDADCHAIALDEWSQQRGCSQVFYPDHVVFLGASIPDTLDAKAPAVAVPGVGTLVRRDAKPSIEPMLRCIGDVFRRLPRNAPLQALSRQQVGQLLNWDAEKYRQTLKLS